MGTSRKNILIIDDEAVFREAMTRALTSCDYRCVAEQDPASGIIRLKREPFDLVLLDIMMEPVDGWDTLSNLQTFSNGKETPVIMASAKKLDINEIIRYGEEVAGFIEKPFLDAELCTAISEFFEWYDALLANAHAARLQGVSEENCRSWIRTNRQIHAINQMLEHVNPICIPDDNSMTEEECREARMAKVREIIDEKITERERLRTIFPVFSV